MPSTIDANDSSSDESGYSPPIAMFGNFLSDLSDDEIDDSSSESSYALWDNIRFAHSPQSEGIYSSYNSSSSSFHHPDSSTNPSTNQPSFSFSPASSPSSPPKYILASSLHLDPNEDDINPNPTHHPYDGSTKWMSQTGSIICLCLGFLLILLISGLTLLYDLIKYVVVAMLKVEEEHAEGLTDRGGDWMVNAGSGKGKAGKAVNEELLRRRVIHFEKLKRVNETWKKEYGEVGGTGRVGR
eukprot:CAMPEP_0118650572 /NCGR_PEP_ID=MMETSP0785-20121206/10317_1 /TAXON_ID=91992 /ORGANISM="Bolidomonas pacifica, Strain CCMP 1866" /LENGTH=240 /DNA_ID=CAMNT_0006542953 /DNA_START=158 /DNA_END=877 /DNA_ORIENTATION=+